MPDRFGARAHILNSQYPAHMCVSMDAAEITRPGTTEPDARRVHRKVWSLYCDIPAIPGRKVFGQNDSSPHSECPLVSVLFLMVHFEVHFSSAE